MTMNWHSNNQKDTGREQRSKRWWEKLKTKFHFLIMLSLRSTLVYMHYVFVCSRHTSKYSQKRHLHKDLPPTDIIMDHNATLSDG